jgi:hypothetical protein
MKPASTPRRRSKRPTLRFKLDGEWWTVKVQRPPSKELVRRHDRFSPSVSSTSIRTPSRATCSESVAHEIGHATMPCVDETHIRDHERVVSVVARWLANTFCEGKISIGQHRRDK